jgi:DNA-binding LacI/PurR family transcriptional regulator
MATSGKQTMADIARLAGVSKSTVSRALNDSPLISPETKGRIRAIARERRFEMNVAARNLSLKQSHAVALVTYAYPASSGIADAFMLELQSGISAALHEQGYDLLVVHVSPDDTDWARQYIETGRVDGFILLCTRRHMEKLAELGVPVIGWGPSPAAGRYCSVGGDSVTGGQLATEHLLRSGRRRIAFLGGPERDLEVQERYRGYEMALAEAGTAVDPDLIANAKWDSPETTGADAMRELLAGAPDLDAVFANSDRLAIAAMDVIRTEGRRIPEDIAVVGYDDVSIARHTNPPLTTIRQNGPLGGRLLAENLLQYLRTGAVTNVTIPAELVVRSSA